MKKIKTMFKRDIVNHKVVAIYNEVVEGCEWVLNEPCRATRKYDGSASAIMDGVLYARLDFRNLKSKKLPQGAIACQDEADSITRSHPYWIPVIKKGITVLNACDYRTADVVVDMQYKYHYKAFKRLIEQSNVTGLKDLDGTYELCGKHEKSDPDNIGLDTLIPHGTCELEVTRTFDGIKEFLQNNQVEGIVFYRVNGDMAKIKRSDFGFPWGSNEERKLLHKNRNKRRKRYYNK